jgi:predicted enzyme related to lactoylglutathione lyase
VEFGAADLAKVKAFYGAAFGWSFTDYGPTYAAMDAASAGLDGGFHTEEPKAVPLVILYADDLEAMVGRVTAAGGAITRPIYAFPGGRRFHFRDPAGNELAVWSEAGAD